jgi:Uma2 family endonuclease
MGVRFVSGGDRISIERYQQMVASGLLGRDDRVELIEGELRDVAPIGLKHAALTARLNKFFVLGAGDRAIVSPGGPVDLGQFSEPEPDLSLLRPRADYYASRIPQVADVLLVVEVSDTSLKFDQTIKRDLYARYGIAEYWIVDVNAQRVIVHRAPTPRGYAQCFELSAAAPATVGCADLTLAPLALPDLQLPLGSLFG